MSAPTKARSVVIRDGLRAFLRGHPNYAGSGLDVGRMTRDELSTQVRAWGDEPAMVTAKILSDAGFDGTAPASSASSAPTTTETSQDNDTMQPTAAPDLGVAPAPLADQLDALKSDLIEGGFNSIRPRLAALIEAAAKPPQIITRIVEVMVQPPEQLAPGVHAIKPARAATWGELFGLGSNPRRITVWDHPSSPKSNPAYVFPQAETELVLSQMARSEAARQNGAPAKHALLYGPAGTGKSAWVREFAARTGRPYTCISMSDGLELDQLMGQTVLDGAGGTRWQDGLLLAAMRQPGMVICLDEVGGMRPAVGVAMNGLLQDMVFFVPDTGERVPVAKGVAFVATNNANLMDGGAARGYVGIGRQNRAFADRFGVSVEIGYAPEATEASLLQTYTGCTASLAGLLVSVASLSRAKAQSDDLTHGIGFRRLLAWAECLTDGIDPDAAFRAAVLNTAPAADVEVLRQLALVAIDATTINAALADKTPTKAGPSFTSQQEG